MEGEFESSKNVVSNGCETYMKKFNFNFKFLDRFRKSKELEHESDIDSNDSSNEETITDFQEMPHAERTMSGIPTPKFEDDNFSDENPEDFAEKTLGGYNLDKFREDNKHLINDNLEDREPTDVNMQFNELVPPEKPEAASRFKIRFPKFGRSNESEDKPKKESRSADFTANFERRFKNRLSNASPMNAMDKFSWNDFILKLFSPYTRRRIHGIFIILLVVTFTYLIGKTAALFIGGSTPLVSTVKSNISLPIEKADTTLQDINRISSTNLFNAKESDKTATVKEVKDIASIVCVDAEKPTAEPLKLLDTIVLQDSVKSVASVQVRGSSDLMNVREGEQLNNTVEVARINRMKVILKNLTTGDCEYVASEEEEAPPMPNIKILKPGTKFVSKSPDIKNSGNNFKIKRQLRDKLISNMSEVLTQAKAVQITNPDGSLSFKMTEVVPGSIYSMLNIQDGDIITSINGKKIENLNELMTLMGRIKEIDQFQIGMKRNGMNETLEYGFE